MKTLIISSILFFNSIISAAQSIKDIVSVPSPTAASLGVYGETPVSLSSGTAAISVPIYELKDIKLTMPISLSYNTSGVVVDQHPGWVGTNWSLNAGGMITRVIKGYADDLKYTQTPLCEGCAFVSVQGGLSPQKT